MRFRRAVRRFTAVLATAAIAVGGVILAPSAALAETQAPGALVWSFKSSWNGYLQFGAQGERLVSNGATMGSGMQVEFTEVAGGDYDPSTGLGTIQYQGTFRDVSIAHEFDIEFSNPWVTFTTEGATLSAELSEAPEPYATTTSRVVVANLATPAHVDADGFRVWDGVGGSYANSIQPGAWLDYVGQAIDTLTFSLAYESAATIDPVESTLTLAAETTEVYEDEDVLLQAMATPAEATGSVQLFKDGVEFGDPLMASEGEATFDLGLLSEGTHVFDATFTPTDADVYVGSTSNQVTVTVSERPVLEGPTPNIEVTLEDGTPVNDGDTVYAGDVLTVRGSGFDPEANVSARPPVTVGNASGVYVVFGNFPDVWKPSEGVGAQERKIVQQKWPMPQASYDQVSADSPRVADQLVVMSADGSFETELTAAAADPEVGTYGVFSYVAGGATDDSAQELELRVNFVDSPRPEGNPGEEPGESEGPGDGEAVPKEPETSAMGGLLWSFKSSWNGYLTSSFTGGQRSVANGATLGSDLTVGFVQVPGGDFDATTGLGTIKYQGTFRDVSDAHKFDIAFSNPWVTFTESGVTLSAEVSEVAATGQDDVSRIVVALLDTDEATTNEDGTLEWSSVEGVFASVLQPSEWNRYAGQAIDPVSFVFGAEVVDPVSPASVTTSAPTVKQGETIIFTGTGFESGAEVTATVFSQPVVVGTNTVNAEGLVQFTWTVPAGFTVGLHTVELVSGETVATGSFTVQAAAAVTPSVTTPEPEEQCVARQVTGGWLEWGFLTQFRDYVEGRIAKGTWSGGSFSATGGALNPNQNGIGMANFGGAIVATGHNGLMNYELSAPGIQINGPNSAVLYASTYTTDTSGNPSVSGRVALATLSFGSIDISGDTLSVSGAAATLTPAGAGQFGQFAERYPAGTALDPVSFSVTLGAEVPCDSTTDPEVLAATGHTGSGESVALTFAALAMLLGAGLVAIRRRNLAREAV